MKRTITISDSLDRDLKNHAKTVNMSVESYIGQGISSWWSGESTFEDELMYWTTAINDGDDEAPRYSPAQFVFREVLGTHGPKRNLSVRLPDALAEGVAEITGSASYPHKTPSDFLADAIWHRLQQLRLRDVSIGGRKRVEDDAKQMRELLAQEKEKVDQRLIAGFIDDVEKARNQAIAMDRVEGEQLTILRLKRSIIRLQDLLDTFGEAERMTAEYHLRQFRESLKRVEGRVN